MNTMRCGRQRQCRGMVQGTIKNVRIAFLRNKRCAHIIYSGRSRPDVVPPYSYASTSRTVRRTARPAGRALARAESTSTPASQITQPCQPIT